MLPPRVALPLHFKQPSTASTQFRWSRAQCPSPPRRHSPRSAWAVKRWSYCKNFVKLLLLRAISRSWKATPRSLWTRPSSASLPMLQKMAKGALLLFFRWKSIVTGPQLHSSRNQTIWSTAFFKWKRKHCKLSFSKLFVAEHLETHSAPGYSSHSMSLASSFHICQFGIIWLSMVSVTYGKPRNCVLCVESNFLVKLIWQLSWICKIEYFALWKCGFLTHREHKLSTSVTLEFNQSSTQIHEQIISVSGWMSTISFWFRYNAKEG